jgi:hypothetical protein
LDRLQEQLTRACSELGIRIEIDHCVLLESGRQVLAVAWIPELGAAKGMIIARQYSVLRDLADELVAAGYGYSVLSDPPAHEDFELASYIEMFSDWGWAADAAAKPAWMT